MLPALAAAAAVCSIAPADKAWVEEALRTWTSVERSILELPAQQPPKVIAIGPDCTGHRSPDGQWTTAENVSGRATIPGGTQVPVAPISFASSDDGGFFVMSVPSVWKAAGVTSALGLERLMTGVLLHEMMHARQFYFANPHLEALTARYSLPDDINDDSLQERFKADPAYVAVWERERDLLFEAAAAPDDAQARRLAGEALAMMRARRARYFSGADAQWAPLDDIFLTMEGLGQWLIHAWLTSPDGPAIDAATAREEVRRKRTQWSQEEGLGLFLVVDRLVPGWKAQVFAAEPLLAEALLEQAANPAAAR